MPIDSDLNKIRRLNKLRKVSEENITWESGKKQRKYLHKFKYMLKKLKEDKRN